MDDRYWYLEVLFSSMMTKLFLYGPFFMTRMRRGAKRGSLVTKLMSFRYGHVVCQMLEMHDMSSYCACNLSVEKKNTLAMLL